MRTWWPRSQSVSNRTSKNKGQHNIFVKRRSVAVAVALLFVCTATACRPWPWGDRFEPRGLASWYGNEYHGRCTASGEVFDQEAMTAAHRTLPFGSVVEVTNLRNGRTVRVRINDRGPFVHGRVIDLSKGAARHIDMIRDGIVPVHLRVI